MLTSIQHETPKRRRSGFTSLGTGTKGGGDQHGSMLSWAREGAGRLLLRSRKRENYVLSV